MKLDNELLKQIIEETLADVLPEQTEQEIAKAKEESAKAQEEVAKAQEDAAEEKAEVAELEAEKAESEVEGLAAESLQAIQETFQIKKSRLHEIVIEEVREAKKQGIL